MNAQIGILIIVPLILVLFRLARERTGRSSWSLWIALIWLSIGASRNPAEWLSLNAPSNGADRYLEGNPFDRTFLSGLILLGIVALVQRSSRVGPVLRANWAIGLYFGYCLISALWSDHPDVSAKRWFRAIGDVVMVLIVLTDRNWLTAVKRFFSRVGFVLLPLSLLFIYYIPSLGRAYSKGGAPSWTGVAGDKNALGMICLLFGLTSTWHILRSYQDGREGRRKGPLMAHGVLSILAVWLLIKSNSATSLACWIIAGGIMVLTSLSRRARRPGFVHLLVGGAISIVISAMFLNTGSGLVETLGRDNTFTGRTAIWAAAIPLVPNRILGAGFESFWLGHRIDDVEQIIFQRANQAHNGYIEIYLNLGWVGVALLGLLIIKGYRNVLGGVRRQEAAASLRLGYFISAILYNLSEGGFKMMHPI
jgi:O-antigen ligase